MRNAVTCALAGGGLLVAGALGPLCGAVLATPSPSAPRALVLAAPPERSDRTVTLVCESDAPGARSSAHSALVCTRVDGTDDPRSLSDGGGTALPAHGGPVVVPTVAAAVAAEDGGPSRRTARADDRPARAEGPEDEEVPAS
ncbi:hypothetical protein [Streptomyces megasporus]|uniref:hypothetical protein n=1 Tax=Streptomyces megasporus TaxID=44060 RepID=UPI0004E0FBD3|nr:hypothetical protein [Streptomyces megasporus]